jgi:glycerol-3-phosphate dehydrogenase
MGGDWTAGAPLPGGDFPVNGVANLIADLRRACPFLDAGQAARLARAYGTEAAVLLGDAREAADLGRDFGAGLTEREVRWMVGREWARTAEDALWRRSKLGLRLSADDAAALDAFIRSLTG